MKKVLAFVIACILCHMTCFAKYYSQWGQDEFVYKNYFQNYTSGVFIDIGAHDGTTFSNSNFFEKELGWTGICAEPIPEVFAQLVSQRKCYCVQGCVTNRTGAGKFVRVTSPNVAVEMLSGLLEKYDPKHLERVKKSVSRYGGSYEIIDVQCYLLQDLLDQYGITHVNFLSIDTEGGELDIISSIDFSKYLIDVIVVEDNYRNPQFISFLQEKGFNLVTRIHQDLIFVNKNFQPNVNLMAQ